MKREHLPWLAGNPFYTKRFAFYVGRRCRASTIRDVARELRLDWRTVKALEMEYMDEQLRRAGTPGPKVIGIDELSIGRGHNYRIIVSDLIRGRPIWFGGTDRSEKSMDLFYQWLGPRKCRGIRLAVMDMWKPFRNSTLKAGNAPQAEILYDKFHILKHLNEALDKVRKSEYARLSGKDRRFIKGQKYTLLSRRTNLTQEGRQSLKALFKANSRLNKAYLLKEMFDQLWDYKREVWARRFFERRITHLPLDELKRLGVAVYERPERNRNPSDEEWNEFTGRITKIFFENMDLFLAERVTTFVRMLGDDRASMIDDVVHFIPEGQTPLEGIIRENRFRRAYPSEVLNRYVRSFLAWIPTEGKPANKSA